MDEKIKQNKPVHLFVHVHVHVCFNFFVGEGGEGELGGGSLYNHLPVSLAAIKVSLVENLIYSL